MQSEISEEADKGKAFLRTRREAALQSVSECTQKKDQCISLHQSKCLEVRGREEITEEGRFYVDFYSMEK